MDIASGIGFNKNIRAFEIRIMGAKKMTKQNSSLFLSLRFRNLGNVITGRGNPLD